MRYSGRKNKSATKNWGKNPARGTLGPTMETTFAVMVCSYYSFTATAASSADFKLPQLILRNYHLATEGSNV